MAEGLFPHENGESCEIFSAGTKPSQVRPEAIAVMSEIGIDIPALKVVWCSGSGARIRGRERQAAFRRIRDELDERARTFLRETAFATNQKRNA